jgi:hypothetical protein
MEGRQRRLYEARRAGLLARLGDEGIRGPEGIALFDAWEEAAERHGIPRDGPRFWSEAVGWIRDERARRRSGEGRARSGGT